MMPVEKDKKIDMMNHCAKQQNCEDDACGHCGQRHDGNVLRVIQNSRFTF